MIPTAQFAPDRSKFDPNSSDAITNCVPTADGWGPLKDLTLISGALAAECKGAVFVRDSNGAFTIIAGTTVGLYSFKQSDGTWTDISGSSAPYGIPSGDMWSFSVVGSKLIATNITDPVQVYDIDAGGVFADLAGSPPQARYSWVANGYLCLASTNDTGGTRRVTWSGLENIEFWTAGSRGSDYQELSDGGDIAGGVGDERGAFVIQRDRIKRMEFAPGTGFTFRFSDVDTARGAVAPPSITNIGAGDFIYLSESGFFRGTAATAIGAKKVDDWFFDRVDLDFLAEVQGAVDPFRKRVWFRFVASDATKQMVGYDWQLDRWTYSDKSTTCLVSLATPAYTLEDLDNVSSSIDALPYSLDSRVWSGGRPTFAAFDADDKLGYFEGSTMAATLETAEVILNPGYRTMVNSFRAIDDASGGTAQIGKKDLHSDSVTWTSTVSPSTRGGNFTQRADARIHKFRRNIAAATTWTICHGVEVEGQTRTGKL